MLKDVLVTVRMDPKQKSILERAAKELNLTLASWARMVMLQAAGKQARGERA